MIESLPGTLGGGVLVAQVLGVRVRVDAQVDANRIVLSEIEMIDGIGRDVEQTVASLLDDGSYARELDDARGCCCCCCWCLIGCSGRWRVGVGQLEGGGRLGLELVARHVGQHAEEHNGPRELALAELDALVRGELARQVRVGLDDDRAR